MLRYRGGLDDMGKLLMKDRIHIRRMLDQARTMWDSKKLARQVL